jgi:hypothetical protein
VADSDDDNNNDDDNYNNTFTDVGFTTMLKTLETKPKLNTLDMQLPNVEEFDINEVGIYLLLNLGVGDRCAQFVVQNIKNLTLLYIGKQ